MKNRNSFLTAILALGLSLTALPAQAETARIQGSYYDLGTSGFALPWRKSVPASLIVHTSESRITASLRAPGASCLVKLETGILVQTGRDAFYGPYKMYAMKQIPTNCTLYRPHARLVVYVDSQNQIRGADLMGSKNGKSVVIFRGR